MTVTIFPSPVSLVERDGVFELPALAREILAKPMADFTSFSAELAKHAIYLSIMTGDNAVNNLGTEGYSLRINPDRVLINANTSSGSYYGVQTLRWMLPRNPTDSTLQIPCCEIDDFPRFPYRGYMLDEARYFLGKETVLSVLDWMALLKLNRFHWHLTDDQGWRIEILKYPKLTAIGSKRDSTPMLRNKKTGALDNRDDVPHDGHYTQQDIKEIVEYAAARCITAIPEIEMPGHATAALASHPETRCILPDDLPDGGANIFGHHLDGPNIKVSTKWGVHANIFCVGNPGTIDFLHNVLREISGLFPGSIIHIGGDEVPKAQWMCCERCQGRMATLGLSIEEDLQKNFTAGIIDFLASLDKKTMLWNEHAGDELADRKDHVICQFWTGSPEKIAGFLQAGGQVVMSPSNAVYMDLAYHSLPLEKVFLYDPLGDETKRGLGDPAAEKAASGGIIGIEAPMWGEVFKSQDQVEYCTFPRVLAVADTCWAPSSKKDHARFMERLPSALAMLDELGIAHATLEDADPSLEAIEAAKGRPDFGWYATFD